MVTSLEMEQILLDPPLAFPKSEDSRTLEEAYQLLGGDPPSDIPFLVWLLENPKSPIALPGKIDLYGHDCIHILLNLSFSVKDEAFILGFTMGNDTQIRWWHLIVFKLIAMFFYPKPYNFNLQNLKVFDLGVKYGKKTRSKNINQLNFNLYRYQKVHELRKLLGLEAPLSDVMNVNY